MPGRCNTGVKFASWKASMGSYAPTPSGSSQLDLTSRNLTCMVTPTCRSMQHILCMSLRVKAAYCFLVVHSKAMLANYSHLAMILKHAANPTGCEGREVHV